MSSILIVRLSSLGDIVHALPVASDLATFFPQSSIDWVVEESFVPIIQAHPLVRNVLPVSLRHWRHHLFDVDTWRQMHHSFENLRAIPYDMVLDVQGLIKSAAISRMARGSSYGFGKDAAREPLASVFYQHTFVPQLPKDKVHVVQYTRAMVTLAVEKWLGKKPNFGTEINYGIRPPPAMPTPWLPDSSAPYCVIVPWSANPAKLWPLDHWQSVGAALQKMGLTCVITSGSPAEEDKARQWQLRWPEVVVAPRMKLNEVMSLLAGATITLGVDTGLAHLSVALKRPTLSVYVASSPTWTGLIGNDDTRMCTLGRPGEIVTAQHVVSKIQELLF